VNAATDLRDILRTALPPVTQDEQSFLAYLVRTEGALVCVDCEWHRETGELELIGVGNAAGVAQLEWDPRFGPEALMFQNAFAGFIASNTVVYHNADADLRALRRAGFDVGVAGHQRLEDTMLAHAVLYSEEDHDLAYVRAECGGSLPPCEELHGTREKDRDAWLLHNAVSVVDTVVVWRRGIEPAFAADPAAEYIYRSQSLAILPEIIAGNERGIAVDPVVAYELRDAYAPRIEQGLRLAQAWCGYPINLSSPDQRLHQFYNVEGFPVQYKKARPGDDPPATTDKDALAVLRRLQGTEWDDEAPATLDLAEANIDAGGHPLLEALYLYSGAKQRLSHYVLPCFDDSGAPRARIYPETRMHAQETGRHSIVGPALQQFKRREDYLIRPDAGWPWFGWDWSNIETWLLGYLAGDALILEAKRQGWDTHTVNFCDLVGIPYPPKLTKAVHACPCADCTAWRTGLKWVGDDDIRRTFSKRCIFRTHYRGNPEQMGDIPGAKALGFDAKTMTAAVNRYLDKHFAIREFWQEIERQVDRDGLVRSFMGRPRRLTAPGRNARYREACNDPLQAGVADIYNQTIVIVKRALPHVRLVHGRHDAQWWAIPEDRWDVDVPVIKAVAERMFFINGYEAWFPASWKERR
jgi:DNA polymerase I-like protein with 3'-5' exonuclease and polymerase domains